MASKTSPYGADVQATSTSHRGYGWAPDSSAADTPQVSTSTVELSAPQSPTTSVCAIPVTEPTLPKGNLTLVSLNSNHTILTLTVGSSQFPLKYYVGPSTRDKMISGKYINFGTLLIRNTNKFYISSILAIYASGQLIDQPKHQHKFQILIVGLMHSLSSWKYSIS